MPIIAFGETAAAPTRSPDSRRRRNQCHREACRTSKETHQEAHAGAEIIDVFDHFVNK